MTEHGAGKAISPSDKDYVPPKDRLTSLLCDIDAPVTPYEIRTRTQVPFSVDAIRTALNAMVRDRKALLVSPDRFAHPKWTAEQKPAKAEPAQKVTQKAAPIISETIPAEVAQPEDKPMEQLETKHPIDRALTDLEIRLLGRQVDDFETKDHVLERLGLILDPTITAVLDSIRGDLRTMHKAA